MFAKPRARKLVAPPPSKKRKIVSAVEEVNFDFDAREDYLTGFHKRKLQRVKWAQEQAAKKAREEKIEMRKQIREERQKGVEEHVKAVNALLEEAQAADSDNDQEIQAEDFEEWDGIEDQGQEQAAQADIVDYEDEYIDEDRYTTVKVEAIAVTRDGLEKLHRDSDEEADSEHEDRAERPLGDKEASAAKSRKEWPKKKPKFRYESKLERQLGDRKAKAKKKARFKN
ncbi:nucleolar protein nop25 [Colletotrichum truncatum]|uniref:Nucleolar protein nop25 n=1 Tax=Colletotrichum truncatum TaxID=5467 RepID=A0ACC3ZIU1_COLTU|nr:nucleolar protein nop25 [Colletotrichum truncatum]KAF6791887.1 nucleolar protein nop25 [Colletotrichum truncatum]